MNDASRAIRGGYDSASQWWLALYLVLFLVLSVAKAPQVLIGTRFWAEEGANYFAQFQTLGIRDVFQFVYNGNFLFLTNAIVYFATKVPLAYAPAVTTYAAYLVEALVVVLIHQVVVRYGVNRLAGLLLTVAWTLMPTRYETGASSTNLQWTCSVSMLFLVVLPKEDIARHFGKSLLWTVLCGLNGVTSCMLAPGYLMRAWFERSRHFAILGVILCLCAAVHLLVLKHYGAGARELLLDARRLTMPGLLQTVLVPLLGVDLIDVIARPIREGVAPASWSALVYVAGIGLMLIPIVLAARAQGLALVAVIGGLWILVSVLNSFGALDRSTDLISPLAGARYYLMGATCFCLMLALGTTARAGFGRHLAIALLGIVVATSIDFRMRGTWTPLFTEGPSWKEGIAKCVPGASCTVPIWPQGWSVAIVPRD
jgi:hypothetical protein